MSAPSLLEAIRTVRRPTLFLPGLPSREPEEYATLPEVLARLHQLADGRPISFKPGHAYHPDFEPFPAIHAYAGDAWIASLGNRWDGPAQASALERLRAAA